MLTGQDYRDLATRWLDMATIEAAGIQRVDNLAGRDYVGGDKKRDLAGLWIPYLEYGNYGIPSGKTPTVCGGRIRRDHPEVERKPDGTLKAKNKYISPVGFNRLYLPPGVTRAQMSDATLTVLYVEGEFKTLAASRLSIYESPALRFLPIGMAGAWNWQGKTGKHQDATGETVDEYGPISDHQMFAWNGRKVVLAFDRDVKANPSIRAARHRLRQFLLSQGAVVGNLEWEAVATKHATYGGEPLPGGPREIEAKGFDDWLARDGPVVALKAISEVEFVDGSDWRSKLICREGGFPKPLVHNAILALESSSTWMGSLHFDSFLNRLTCTRRPWKGPRLNPEVWRANDSTRLAAWLQEQRIEVGIDTARAGAACAAEESDALETFVSSCEWDGTPRLDRWLIDYMGVQSTNPDGEDITNYVCAVGATWMVGGVARALDPGCQMDYALVLCGDEGLGKSSALKIIANSWYTGGITDIKGDEALFKLEGRWIVEFREIEAWRKAEAEDLRGFISERSDEYRSKYDRSVESHPRRCVFAGTTNKPWFLDPDSINRRYWPVTVARAVDIDGLQRDYVQLWAEACDRYLDGARPFISDPSVVEMALRVRAGFQQIEDPWTDLITNWIEKREGYNDPFSMADVLQFALAKDKQHMGSGRDTIRVANILKRQGYINAPHGKKRVNRWRLASST